MPCKFLEVRLPSQKGSQGSKHVVVVTREWANPSIQVWSLRLFPLYHSKTCRDKIFSYALILINIQKPKKLFFLLNKLLVNSTKISKPAICFKSNSIIIVSVSFKKQVFIIWFQFSASNRGWIYKYMKHNSYASAEILRKRLYLQVAKFLWLPNRLERCKTI